MEAKTEMIESVGENLAWLSTLEEEICQAEVNPQVNLGVFQKVLDRWRLKKRES
jgi:hypothetical protein